MDPRTPQVSREDALLLIASVIADLEIVTDRARRRLPAGSPAAQIANQLRHLNRHTDPYTKAVNTVLFAIADALEEAAGDDW